MVNTFLLDNSDLLKFSYQELLKRLWYAAATVGPEKLDFSPNNIGLHSAHSGAAMAMYLASVPVFTVMLLGRWSSDAFLHYINKQVKEFSSGISNKMIRNKNFFTISSASAEDPWVANHALNLATWSKHGLNFQDMILTLASVFH